jgi:hypothetical protein
MLKYGWDIIYGNLGVKIYGWDIKIVCKFRKSRHWNPLLGHIGDDILENGNKKVIGLQWGMKLTYFLSFQS